MPDTWRCECGYTNLGSKTCLVCRRPRQAVPSPPREAAIDEPAPAPPETPAKAEKPEKKAAKRPLRASTPPANKRPVRKKTT